MTPSERRTLSSAPSVGMTPSKRRTPSSAPSLAITLHFVTAKHRPLRLKRINIQHKYNDSVKFSTFTCDP
ncbi:hypothetical protein ACHAWO_004040 [Cyclotella atomus]|uniref:Uncharacterized protein n=1 Tax=Cyclotella atomus TaxID=382360 RepID=A0ABD3NXC3_9STRA